MQKQYPGALGIFRSVLEGMQHFDKVEILRIIQGDIVERITTLVFVIAFRMYGEANVSYGILMGIVIGYIIGTYIDDVAFSILSLYFLHKILKRYFGLTIRHIFRVKYSKDVLKNVFFYGLQGSALPFLGSFVSTYTLLTYVGYINSYTTWVALISTGMGLAGQLGQFGNFSLTTAIAEAQPMGKVKLAEFYVTYSIRWRYFFMMLLTMILLAMMPFYFVAVKELEAFKYYQGIEIFMIPGIISRLLWVLVEIPDSIMWGARHITQHTILRIVEEFGKIFFVWLFVTQWRIHETWGLIGLTYLLGFRDWVPIFIKTAAGWIYCHIKILKIKIYWIPTFIIPVISAIPSVLLAQLFYHFGFFPIKEVLGLIPTLVICIFMFFLFVIYTFFPLNAILGGFDDYQLFVFSKAVDLSGPSKPIFKGVLKLVNGSVKIGRKLKLHGRFPIPYEEAHKEIRELMEIKRKHLEENNKKIENE